MIGKEVYRSLAGSKTPISKIYGHWKFEVLEHSACLGRQYFLYGLFRQKSSYFLPVTSYYVTQYACFVIQSISFFQFNNNIGTKIVGKLDKLR